MKRNLRNLVVIKCTILIFLFAAYSCSETPTEPEQIEDPREYVWSVDTIKYPEEDGVVQSLISSVWGSSENDVYITGHADSGNRIFHYNGSTWEVIDRISTGIGSSFDSEWIHGFSSSDIWFAGDKIAPFDSPLYPNHVPTMLHYNGSKWELHELPVEGRFRYTWGKSSNNLWACGDRGMVGHYDGKNWEIDSIQIAAGNYDFNIFRIIEYGNSVYANGYKHPVRYFCKKNKNEQWAVVDSFVSNADNIKFGESGFYITSANKLMSYGYEGIWEYEGDNNWIKKVTFEGRGSLSGFMEYTNGQFILSDFRGKIYHYDGSKLEEIKDIGSSGYIYNLWANSKECFVVVNKWGSGIASSTVVYHGK